MNGEATPEMERLEAVLGRTTAHRTEDWMRWIAHCPDIAAIRVMPSAAYDRLRAVEAAARAALARGDTFRGREELAAALDPSPPAEERKP